MIFDIVGISRPLLDAIKGKTFVKKRKNSILERPLLYQHIFQYVSTEHFPSPILRHNISGS